MTTKMNAEKIANTFHSIMKVFSDNNLKVGEILFVLANVMYTLGQSIDDDVPVRIEDVEQKYYEEPNRIGLALVLQSSLFSQWINNMNKEKE